MSIKNLLANRRNKRKIKCHTFIRKTTSIGINKYSNIDIMNRGKYYSMLFSIDNQL